MKTSLCAYWSTLELVPSTLLCFTYIFLKIKQHRLKLCTHRFQCILPPFPQYIIPLIPSEQKATLVATHTSVGRWEMGSMQATSSNSKTSWWIFTLEPCCFFPWMRSKGPHNVNAVFAAWILLAFISSTGLYHFGFVSLFFFPFLSENLDSCSFLSALGRFCLFSN